MPLGSDDIQYKVFGQDGTVYPGHPVSIGYLIVLTYASFEDAVTRTEPSQYPNALANGAIPGAGGNVYGALDMLKHCFTHGVEVGLQYGDTWWAGSASGANFGDRHGPGQTQADTVKERFREAFARWPRASAAAAATSVPA